MPAPRYILVDEDFQKQVLSKLERLEALYSVNTTAAPITAGDDVLMDTVDLQNHLKCCRRTLLKHRKAGLPFVQRESGRIYYWKSQVDKYFEKP